ncbi:hypothetical protein [Spectribacter hydrogenoxidans]|uniref:Tetratricopeptide repeat protein n=1 Tax=Spectribacter hydrogenoxidans TaxID=3075608 RepID=A0ABU3C096_9GAMM|nr:hypothetical protein [Salinisphaera sp. W335]MDT0634975.1 hypothetical protein [Salinisphaera sp. W335]
MRAPHGLVAVLLVAASLVAAGSAAWQAERLHQADARWQAATDRPLSALSQLRARQLDDEPLAAQLYAGAGLTTSAGAILERHRGADTAHLALAGARLAAGDPEAAIAALTRMRLQLDPEAALARARLLARAQLHLGRGDPAALALAGQREIQTLPRLARYHLGLAWLQTDEPERGLGILQALGTYSGPDPAGKLLADQANVLLGFWLLNRNRGSQARQAFLRVRLNRPLSRKAMLGLGWSEISAGALTQSILERQLQVCPPEDAELWADADPLHQVSRRSCRQRRFEDDQRLMDSAALQATESSQYRRAAVAWRAAIRGGAPTDPVVAEALAALPHALWRAGDATGAEQGFQRAIGRLETAVADAAGAAPPGRPDTTRRALGAIANNLRTMHQHLGARGGSLSGQLARLPDSAPVQDLAAALNAWRADNGRGSALTLMPHGGVVTALPSTRNASAVTAAPDEARLRRLAERVQELATRHAALEQQLSQAVEQQQQQRRDLVTEQLNRYLSHARQGLAALYRAGNPDTP